MSETGDSRKFGWYPDPDGQPVYVLWDGDEWTDRTKTTAQLRRSNRRSATAMVFLGLLMLLFAGGIAFANENAAWALVLASSFAGVRAVSLFRRSFALEDLTDRSE